MRSTPTLASWRARLAAGAMMWIGIIAIPHPVAAGSIGTVDAPVDGGAVVITQPDNTARPVAGGDSNSEFSLRLPDGAACPGDSYSGQWRVQSFIIPAADDPGSLRYGIIWPDGDGRRSLYTAKTQPFSHILTARSDGPGEPGPIFQPPPMTFAVYQPGLFPAGNYRIGLACTLFRETAVFWDTEITIADTPDVRPGEFTWSPADSSVVTGADLPRAGNSGSSDTGIIVAIGLAAAAIVAVVSQRRRSSRNHLKPQEQS